VALHCRFERGILVRDLYKVLGIAATADGERIKTAFRRRAKAFHPDLNPGDDRAEERFKELTEAYEVLRSAHARATYDAYRAQRRSVTRRRIAGSAALTAASFVLTLGSAFAVLAAVHDAGTPFRDGWRTVVHRVASAFGPPGESRADEWAKGTSVVSSKTAETQIAKDAPLAAVKQAGAARRHEAAPVGQANAEAAVQAKAERKVAAVREAAPRPAAPSSADRHETDRNESALQSVIAIGDESRTWPAEDSPRMSLGATNR
jgi:curved DNA-binding protein CbpA